MRSYARFLVLRNNVDVLNVKIIFMFCKIQNELKTAEWKTFKCFCELY